jgi:hypothetical protein
MICELDSLKFVLKNAVTSAWKDDVGCGDWTIVPRLLELQLKVWEAEDDLAMN